MAFSAGAQSTDYPEVDVRNFGAVGDGTTNNNAAFAAAIAIVNADRGVLKIPAGHYKLTSDLILTQSVSSISGDGLQTFLDFDGAGIIVDATNAVDVDNNPDMLRDWSLNNFRVRRTGAVGPAIYLKADCNEADTAATWRGHARFSCYNIKIDASTGVGWEIEYSYLADFTSCFVLGCVGGGWRLMRSPTNRAPGAALQWFGGETQGCHVGWRMGGTKSCALFGHSIEDNIVCGFEDYGDNTGLMITGGHIESNGNGRVSPAVTGSGYDIRIGLASAYDPSHGVHIHGVQFWSGDAAKQSSIELNRVRWFTEGRNTYVAYAGSAVDNKDTAGTDVFGISQTSSKTNDGIQVLNTATAGMHRNPTWVNNTVTQKNSGAIGEVSVVTAECAMAIGYGHVVDKNESLVIGEYGKSDMEGSLFIAGGRNTVTGDSQTGILNFKRRTTTASFQNMTGSYGGMIVLPAATKMGFFVKGEVIGVDEATGNTAAYSLSCAVKWDGTTAQINKAGTTGTFISFDVNHDGIAVSGIPYLETSGALIRPGVYGKASTNIKWSCTLTITKVVA